MVEKVLIKDKNEYFILFHKSIKEPKSSNNSIPNYQCPVCNTIINGMYNLDEHFKEEHLPDFVLLQIERMELE